VLGGFARTVVGFSPQASRDLIRILQDYAHPPSTRCAGSGVRATSRSGTTPPPQHYAIFDYGTARRRGERVTVAGPVPVGTDGRPSVALRGEATAYYRGAA